MAPQSVRKLRREWGEADEWFICLGAPRLLALGLRIRLAFSVFVRNRKLKWKLKWICAVRAKVLDCAALVDDLVTDHATVRYISHQSDNETIPIQTGADARAVAACVEGRLRGAFLLRLECRGDRNNSAGRDGASGPGDPDERAG